MVYARCRVPNDRQETETSPYRRRIDALALLGFVLVAFLYFGLALTVGAGSEYLGTASDPQIFIWSFAWWPHALLHGLNPFVTHAIWAPTGVNLTWTTTVPGLALLFAPLTYLVGPVDSYNVAATLMPALAAWTAYLLCRHLTRNVWASLVGGYLFGFSSYMLGQETSHLHMSSVFLLPVVALLVTRYVQDELDGRGLAIRLGPLLALQLLFSTELSLTIALALAGALIVAWLVSPERRPRIVSSLRPLSTAYLIAGALTAPFLYYLAVGLHTSPYTPPEAAVGDLLNFVIPTKLPLLGPLTHATAISDRFPANYSENGSFLGPAIVIVALFARSWWRTAVGRFLLASCAVGAFFTLGSELTVAGHGLLPLPWRAVIRRPLFDNILPDRLSLFTSLGVAVIVAIWTAARRDRWRWALPALSVLALFPNPGAGVWSTTYSIPAFFTDSTYRSCLARNENILPLPEGIASEATLWQVADAFRFRMTAGRVATTPPTEFMHPSTIQLISTGKTVPAGQARVVAEFIEAKEVTSVVVRKDQVATWGPVLDRLAKPQDVGGVRLYHVAGNGASCRAAG